LAQLELEADDYAWLTRELVSIADRHANGRIVSLLEGGYDLQALARMQCRPCRRPGCLVGLTGPQRGFPRHSAISSHCRSPMDAAS
jgi:hypothetical protein